MQSIGQRLKNKRLEKRLSLEDVYTYIKIHPRVLIALENDTVQEKLNIFYIKNFLYTYAEFLGLDSAEILQEYSNFNKADDESLSQTVEQINIPAFLNKYKLTVVLIPFLIIFAFGLFPFLKPLQDVASFKLQEDLNFQASFNKPSSKVGFPVIDKGQQLKLVVSVKNKVWLQAKSDEKIIFEGNLKKGDMRYWVAGDSFELWVSDGKSLELELNKQLLGSLGGGAIKNIVITRQGMESFSGK